MAVMKGHLLIQAFFLCVLAIYVTKGLQSDELTQYETRNSPPLARAERATKTTPRPGFFNTLFSVLYEQWDDTRKTSGAVSKAVNDNFLPEGKNGATPPPTVVNGTTTEETRITRTELQKILLRNLRGIQKLFQVELNDALKESRKTYQDFNKNVSREMLKFL
ncbi:uncharacterized protein LOC114325156 [Diabrotica virgifera virgifera]|uniref:Uncharacterized protein LOC114325156 n=1 Tax=Diabrotica virgifera virgifera TaxID=50390 RepID=A0A6P7F232_DIAVI|nr:uncharacterized protein LOC114325156 [Diabrotica virgifera virgifera]XP_028128917.1 uncharacterized protein LOC114325156 [Diabrotica virgifera virgifera]XP_028128918.1 uncharacterized protein LOC114325156 [Diabrotica virgifera virgifera]XP_028128919.1 uncharacterized protein LOC114325156 [Diabrotica virgifera virgifera]